MATLTRDTHTAWICSGDWTIHTLNQLPSFSSQAWLESLPSASVIVLDAQRITSLDLAGCAYLKLLITQLQARHISCKLQSLPASLQSIYEYAEQYGVTSGETLSASDLNVSRRWFDLFSKVKNKLVSFVQFIGELFLELVDLVKHRQLNARYLLALIQTTGFQALPIVGLLSFLIGIVLSFEMGIQLKHFGANIFIVDLLGLAVLREFAPFMTAIIIAARSGASLTAEIGSMKLREELDALQSMGISPMQHLVIPNLLAQWIVLPLLTTWAIMTALLGGLCMSTIQLDILPRQFILRFHDVVEIKQLFLGMLKVPFFAFLIATIGAFRGFSVTNSAGSVGRQTTHSVVNALFMIIVVDAIFAVSYSLAGL